MFNFSKKDKEIRILTDQLKTLERKFSSLEMELKRYKGKEEENKIKYSERLEYIEGISGRIGEMQEYSLEDKLQYFNRKYPIKKYDKIDRSMYKEFETESHADSWGRELYDNWAKILKDFRSIIQCYRLFPFDKYNNLNYKTTAVELYCGYLYRQMNSLLRKVYRDSIETVPYYEQLCNLLVLEMLAAPRINQGVVLYRLIDDVNFTIIMETLHNEQAYVEEGLMSTTLLNTIENDGVSEPYSNVDYSLRLYVPKNSIGIYSSPVAGRTFEHEIILLNKGMLEPIRAPYIDGSIKKIVLECSYVNREPNVDICL